MRTLRWSVGRIFMALTALAFFPNLSVALDCSYNHAFKPPLPADSGGTSCVASKSLKSHGEVEIPADSPLEVDEGVILRLRNSGESPGSLMIDPNASLVSGGSELEDPVVIEAAQDFISKGHLQLYAPEQILRLRGTTSLQLLGTGATGNTEITADSIKLESSKGDITLDGVSISAEYVLDINAPKG
ncbi:MAG: hypothetical protein HY268_10800, partial [Deltaproteobacteria bacterium]|nr:hypothetical protein [Deltaproteobacteria bacterium]